MAKVHQKEEERHFHQELIKELVTLSTSGFGLVAALAWNETIQALVKGHIYKLLPFQATNLISQLIYAILITALAVLITYQLSRLASRWGVKK